MSIKNFINVTGQESKNVVKSFSNTLGKALNTTEYKIANESSAADD